MLDKWHKKEKPVFTGITRGIGGFGFGGGGGGASNYVTATGGIKYWNSSENGGTMYHIFQDSGDFEVTNSGDVEVLIVAGGGSGADGQGGGGGGGGVVHGATVSVSGTIPVVVGDGGEPNGPGGNYNRSGYKGQSSSFDGVTAIGGGGGTRSNYVWGGLPNAEQIQIRGANSGGGGGGTLSGSGSDFPSDAILPQPVPGSYVAYGGKYGAPGASTSNGSGGGGGGAGANSPGPSNPRGANVRSPGGAGKAIPSFNSTNIDIMPSSWTTEVGPTGLYGGAGGGGDDGPSGQGFGGPGGGGDGQSPSAYPAPAATANTGGGGGDRGAPNLPHVATAGAKGIVIVKYQSAVTSDVNKTFGGTQYKIGNYSYHVFSAGESSITVTGPVTYDILVVAGGGAGGTDKTAGASGGGGGGGVIFAENQTMATGAYNVFVGSGGAYQPGAPSPSPKGDSGGNSVFSSATIPSSVKADMTGHSMPASTWLALGGGGGAGAGNNDNIQGREAGTGGGGGSTSGSGGAGTQTTQSSLPAISKTYGSGTAGRSSGSYPARGGGGGGHSPNSYGQGNQLQGGTDGYQVPASFLPTSVPAGFANLLGANHPAAKGGGIATNSPEWRYFAGGGGGSDNVPATSDSFQASGGLGGGGNAGGDGRTSPSNPRTARTGTQYYNAGNEASPGVHGRGGGGAGNGLDDSGNSVDYFGGTGGDGIIILRVHDS